jgi:anti-sigma factor RsiW
MSCQEFWKRLSRPPGEEQDLDPEHNAHLAQCPSCAARMDRQRELRAGLKLVAERFSGLKAPARVEGRLLRAFRAQNGLETPAGRRGWMVPACWAAAAALLLAAGIWLSGSRQPAPPRIAPAVAELAAVSDVEAASADADGFIPLPNAESLGPNDDVNIVRMEVPRSTIVELGFEVSADRGADRVEADVLLGSDGLAKAVRFLE